MEFPKTPSKSSLLLLTAGIVLSATCLAQAQPRTGQKPEKSDRSEIDVSAAQAVDLRCAQGERVTLYSHAGQDDQVSLRWKKQLIKLERVETTTGAQRFENAKLGWTWIGIPAKSMLLDSKKGQQLLNECRTEAQTAGAPIVPAGLLVADK